MKLLHDKILSIGFFKSKNPQVARIDKNRSRIVYIIALCLEVVLLDFDIQILTVLTNLVGFFQLCLVLEYFLPEFQLLATVFIDKKHKFLHLVVKHQYLLKIVVLPLKINLSFIKHSIGLFFLSSEQDVISFEILFFNLILQQLPRLGVQKNAFRKTYFARIIKNYYPISQPSSSATFR